MTPVAQITQVRERWLLNVGGGASRALPDRYQGWHQDVLDADPAVSPDIVLDAKALCTLKAQRYDAVFCSHTLEHFYKHEVQTVLQGFLHVLTEDGHADIIVPNVTSLLEAMRANNLDIGDTWYRTQSGAPITFHDALYGWNHAMENGNLFYAHKCGFTAQALGDALLAAGFKGAQIWGDAYNLYAKAFKKDQT